MDAFGRTGYVEDAGLPACHPDTGPPGRRIADIAGAHRAGYYDCPSRRVASGGCQPAGIYNDEHVFPRLSHNDDINSDDSARLSE